MVDYYLIRKGEIDIPALYREDGEFRFQGLECDCVHCRRRRERKRMKK